MHLTRRYFLQTTGALSAYMGIAPLEILNSLAGPTSVMQTVSRGKTLVVVFLRGGADGLNLVIPHGDPHYAKLRPTLGIAPSREATDLDGFFSLHPQLASLAPLFESKLAVAAHAVGYDKNTRSHFEEQDVWETGVIGNTLNSDGWLNRHLATSEGHGDIRAAAIGDNLPRILQGERPAFAIRGVEDLALPDSDQGNRRAIVAALEHAYCSDPRQHRRNARDLLAQSTGVTLEGMKQLEALTKERYQPKAPYPQSELARRLMQVARLIKADVGLEVAEVDFDGWDTHRNQGRGAGGTFGTLAGTLGSAVAAFVSDLEDRLDDVLLVTLTDFGRTAAENGTGGTDHGWANCMFLLGGPVRRGHLAARKAGQARKVVSDWPGLAPEKLNQGRDLLHTMDFRNVLAELVGVHLGNPNLATVLPNHSVEQVGLIA